MLKETVSVFRHLILDDDVRVEISEAHKHAKTIATEVLVELTQLLPVHIKDKNILSELLLTIAALNVRHEFCLQVEEADGLKFIFDAMVSLSIFVFTSFFYFWLYFHAWLLFILYFTERAFRFHTSVQRIIETVTRIGW